MLNFDGIDWPDPIRIMQTNWIGRSEGADVTFTTEHGDELEVFTTRPDTLWGATFMVLAPEHPLVGSLTTDDQRAAVTAYQEAHGAPQSEIERMEAEREKTGVFTGGYAVNPVNDERIPVWIADYVLLTYGSGAIMAVPAHDERDFEFARQFDLPVVPVIHPAGEEPLHRARNGRVLRRPRRHGEQRADQRGGDQPREGPQEPVGGRHHRLAGGATRSDGKPSTTGCATGSSPVSATGGARFPMVFEDSGEIEAVPDDALPVLLPEDVDFQQGSGNPLNWHDGVPAHRRFRGRTGPARDRHAGHVHVLVVVPAPLPVTRRRPGGVRS